METKICGKCIEIKETINFGIDSRTKSGYRSTCNDCRKIESKEYRDKNPQKRKEILLKYYQNNKEKELLRFKKYRESNPEKRKETCRKYVENNKDKHNEYSKNWKKLERIKNPKYKLINNLRKRTKDFLNYKKENKNTKIIDIVGCSPQFLKEHLEKKFKDGMSWENYGFYGWHIDHIIPLSSAKTEEEIYKLCHYTNLQPLWAKENLKKNNKIIDYSNFKPSDAMI
jgi:hypothetical protein